MNNNTKKNAYEKFVFISKFISLSFSCVVLLIYFSFILVIGFRPEILSIFIDNTSVTYGVAIGLSIIIFSILLTFVFTIIANNYLDKLRREIK